MAGVLAAFGIALPQYTAHLAGANAGRMFLPMHIPTLLAGLLCGPLYGGIVGIVSPVMSCVITGGTMPPAYPMLPIMCAELLTYGVVGGLCSNRSRRPRKFGNVYVSLIIAMFFGRVAYGAAYYALLLGHTGGGPFKALSVWGAVTAGVPGIIIQLALIPPAVSVYRRRSGGEASVKAAVSSGEATLIAVKGGRILYRDSGGGISPLINLYENNRDILAGAYVLDKTVGKAAAMLLVLGGAKKVYGELMSESAEGYLNKRGVKTSYAEKTKAIRNGSGTGICPFENAVSDTDDPSEGYAKIKETLSSFKG